MDGSDREIDEARRAALRAAVADGEALRAEAYVLLEGLRLATLRLQDLVAKQEGFVREARIEARMIAAATRLRLAHGPRLG